jgi:hypothetical protein
VGQGVSFSEMHKLFRKASFLLGALMGCAHGGSHCRASSRKAESFEGNKLSLSSASLQPVDWYPLNEEPFKKAQDLDRAILLDWGALLRPDG